MGLKIHLSVFLLIFRIKQQMKQLEADFGVLRIGSRGLLRSFEELQCDLPLVGPLRLIRGPLSMDFWDQFLVLPAEALSQRPIVKALQIEDDLEKVIYLSPIVCRWGKGMHVFYMCLHCLSHKAVVMLATLNNSNDNSCDNCHLWHWTIVLDIIILCFKCTLLLHFRRGRRPTKTGE